MEIHLLRNATMRLRYAQHTLLADPDFAPRHARDSFTGRSRNPMVDLPLPKEAIVEGIEAVLVTHLHADHFDAEAQQLLPKDIPIFCQPVDAERIQSYGFHNVIPVDQVVEWQGMRITLVAGQHGFGADLASMGQVSGFVLSAPHEPTLYWVGDSVWYADVATTIEQFQPSVIVTHSSGAIWEAGTPIVMDAQQTITLCQTATASTVVAVHLDSLDHGQVSRADLRIAANAAGISETQLLIPNDGAVLVFEGESTPS
ncbi:MBL fold metallo-hydrolase [Herpetosiphon llansteffanensis]|uniref:MBL fold metallo-hydrolase n=1 Tax=Herpetosiphon llansteffanensis TaxID=2094568 RepID=UPI000D7C0B53|nr:MBL fold metallo-hydrolase [Herpetosiphon llansteffanensis]